jgi:hypothetical protein
MLLQLPQGSFRMGIVIALVGEVDASIGIAAEGLARQEEVLEPYMLLFPKQGICQKSTVVEHGCFGRKAETGWEARIFLKFVLSVHLCVSYRGIRRYQRRFQL